MKIKFLAPPVYALRLVSGSSMGQSVFDGVKFFFFINRAATLERVKNWLFLGMFWKSTNKVHRAMYSSLYERGKLSMLLKEVWVQSIGRVGWSRAWGSTVTGMDGTLVSRFPFSSMWLKLKYQGSV